VKLRQLIAAIAAIAAAAALAMAPAASASTTSATPAPSLRLHGFRLIPGARLPRTLLPHLAPDATDNSTNWAGYAALARRDVTFRYVTSTFTMPRIDCAKVPIGSAGETYVGEWVGLDGFNDKTVEQTGVASYCTSTRGRAISEGWYQMYPLDPVAFSGVHPGDRIWASVYYNSRSGKYRLFLEDKTTGFTMESVQICPSGSTCHRTSAEVITEDPGGSVAGGTNLADFGTVNYAEIHLTSLGGTEGTMAAGTPWTSTQITMRDPSGAEMATPSALTDGGTDFTITWKRGVL
jgi:hypothetical protein